MKKEFTTLLLYFRQEIQLAAAAAGYGSVMPVTETNFFDTTAGGDLRTNLKKERNLNEDFNVIGFTFDAVLIPQVLNYTVAAGCTPSQPYAPGPGSKNLLMDRYAAEYARRLLDLLIRKGVLVIDIENTNYAKIPLRELAAPINNADEYGPARIADAPFVFPEPITIKRDATLNVKALFDKTTVDLVAQQAAASWADEDPMQMALAGGVPLGPGSSFFTRFGISALLAMDLRLIGPSVRPATALNV